MALPVAKNDGGGAANQPTAPGSDSPFFQTGSQPNVAGPRGRSAGRTTFGDAVPSVHQIAMNRGFDPFEDEPPVRHLMGSHSMISDRAKREKNRFVQRWELTQRLDEIEYFSDGRMASDMTIAMMESALADHELKATSRAFAVEFTLPMNQILQHFRLPGREDSVFINPETNTPISMAQARRIYKMNEPRWFQMFFEAHKDIDPTVALEAWKALAPVAGDDIGWKKALGITAVTAKVFDTRDKMDSLTQNLKLMETDDSLTGEEKIRFAQEAALSGVTFNSGADVIAYHFGDPGPEPPRETPEHEAWVARKETQAYWASQRLQAINRVTAAQTGDVQVGQESGVHGRAQAVAEEGQVELVSDIIKDDGTLDETKLAALPRDEQYAIAIASGNEDQIDGNWGLIAAEIERNYQEHVNAYNNSIMGWTMGLGAQWLDSIGDSINATAYIAGSSVGAAAALMSGVDTKDVRAEMMDRWGAANAMLYDHHDLSLTERLVDDGVPTPLAFGVELGAQLFMDPLNIPFSKAARPEKLAHLLSESGEAQIAKDSISWWKKYSIDSQIDNILDTGELSAGNRFLTHRFFSNVVVDPRIREWFPRVNKFLTQTHAGLRNRTVPQYAIDQAIGNLGNRANFHDAMNHKFTDVLGGKPWPTEILDAVYDWVLLVKGKSKDLNLAEDLRIGTNATPTKALSIAERRLTAARKQLDSMLTTVGDDIESLSPVERSFLKEAQDDVDAAERVYDSIAKPVVGAARSDEELASDIHEIFLYTLRAKRPGKGNLPEPLQDIMRGIEEGRDSGLVGFGRDLPPGVDVAQVYNAPHFQPWMMNKDAADEAYRTMRRVFDYWDSGRAAKVAIPDITGLTGDMKNAVRRLIMESRFGTGIRYRRSVMSSMMADIEQDFPDFMQNYLSRANVERAFGNGEIFSREEIANYVRRAGEIARPHGTLREGRWIKFMEEVQTEMMSRAAKSMGLSPEEAEEFLEGNVSLLRDMNHSLFGLVQGDVKDWNAVLDGDFAAVRHQLLETQLPNKWMMADPAALLRDMREGLGYKQRVALSYRRALGIDITDTAHLSDATLNRVANNMSLYAQQKFLTLWKAGVVATPRYVMRVVMSDEQLRFMADLGFTKWYQSRRSYNWVADKMGRKRQYIEFDMDPTEISGYVDGLEEAGFNGVNDAVAAELNARTARLNAKGKDVPVTDSRLDQVDPLTRRLLESHADWVDKHGPLISAGMHQEPGAYFGPKFPVTIRDQIWINEQQLAKVDRPLLGGKSAEEMGFEAHEWAVSHERAHFVWTRLSKGRKREWNKLYKDKLAKLGGPSHDNPNIESFADAVSIYHIDPSQMPADAKDWFDANWKGEMEALDTASLSVPVSKPALPKIRVELPRAGELLDEVNIKAGKAHEVFTTMDREKRSILKAMSRAETDKSYWDEIMPGQKGYVDTLSHVLVRQIAQSDVGRRILHAQLMGQDPEDTVLDIAAYLMHNKYGKSVASRMGINNVDEAMDHAEEMEAMVRGYVNGSQAVALAAYDGDYKKVLELLDDMHARDPGSMHPVHGFRADEVLGRPNPMSKVWDWYSKIIFEWPTDKLSRQPFFKQWYTDMRTGLLSAAKDQGLGMSDDLLRKINSEARIFAIERVNKVMFDFKRQSRFGEMMSFILPFHQPWKEAFQVWGHLLRKNPAFAERMRVFMDEAHENEWIYRDPVSGELRVPLSNWALMAPMMNMAFGRTGDGKGFSLSAPLESWNFIFGSIFELPTGKIAGNIPIPLPSMNPLAMPFAQAIAAGDALPDAVKPSAMKWAFQYGDMYGGKNLAEKLEGVGLSLLPTYMQHFARAAGFGDQSVIKSAAGDFVRLYEAQGITPQNMYNQPKWAKETFGRTFKSVEDAQTYLAAKAQDQATDLTLWRGVMSLVFPAAPTVSFGTQDLELEYRGLVDKFGYEEGKDKFLKRHPDNALITIPTTYWNNPNSLVPLPANELTQMFLDDPLYADFARTNPMWAFALLPDDAYDQPFDREVFFAQIESGDRQVRGPLDMFKAADAEAGYRLYHDAQLTNIANLERLDALNISDSDVLVQAEEKRFRDYKDAIATIHPGFGEKLEVLDLSNIDPWVEYHIEKALSSDLFASTAVGKGLIAYRKLRDKAMARLAKANVHSLETQTADDLGITKDYDQGVARIIKEFPGFERVFNYFFTDDLKAITTDADKIIDNLNEDPKASAEYAEWRIPFAEYQHTAFSDSDPARVNDAYLRMRNMSNAAWDTYGDSKSNPQNVWWNTRSYFEKKEYLEGLISRPYIFYSRFDRLLLHEETNDVAEDAWINIGRFDNTIAHLNRTNPNTDGDITLYNLRDRFAHRMARENPVFRKQLEHANEWGYMFFSQGDYEERSGREGDAWTTFHATLRGIQTLVNVSDMHGEADFGYPKELYRSLKNRLLNMVIELGNDSPGFQKSWEELEQASPGPDLLDSFMPETWFKLGG